MSRCELEQDCACPVVVQAKPNFDDDCACPVPESVSINKVDLKKMVASKFMNGVEVKVYLT